MLNSENRNLAASARITSKLTSKYYGPVSESASIKAAVVLLRVYQGHLQKHAVWSGQKATVQNTRQCDQQNNYSQLLTFEPRDTCKMQGCDEDTGDIIYHRD